MCSSLMVVTEALCRAGVEWHHPGFTELRRQDVSWRWIEITFDSFDL